MLIGVPSSRLVTTDLNLLITPEEWRTILTELPAKLSAAGFAVTQLSATEISLTCEPDNMLVAQFEQVEGHVPVAEVLHRVLVTGVTALPLVDVTATVAAALPDGAYWYGTTVVGELSADATTSCVWSATSRR